MRTEIIKRYFWLLDTIYRSGDVGITFEEINEKWERNDLLSGGCSYPKRTFESHRQNIEEVFNILIDCDRRTNRYFISDREELKNQNHILKWLVETFNLNDVVGQSKNLKDRIGLEDIPAGHGCLVDLLDAMNRNQTFDMEYQKFYPDEKKLYRNMEPYGVHSISDFFSGCYGIIKDATPKQIVVLKANAFQAKYLKTLPLHESQKIVSEDSVFTTFSYYIRPTFDFKQKILSYMGNVEVVEPLSFRDEIRMEIERMRKLYE